MSEAGPTGRPGRFRCGGDVNVLTTRHSYDLVNT